MSFLTSKPKTPAPPQVPPPAPLPPIKPIKAEGTASAQEKERVRRKRGVSSTILTGPRGLLPEQMPVTSPSLLGGS